MFISVGPPLLRAWTDVQNGLYSIFNVRDYYCSFYLPQKHANERVPNYDTKQSLKASLASSTLSINSPYCNV
jgi:hypothetical protein